VCYSVTSSEVHVELRVMLGRKMRHRRTAAPYVLGLSALGLAVLGFARIALGQTNAGAPPVHATEPQTAPVAGPASPTPAPPSPTPAPTPPPATPPAEPELLPPVLKERATAVYPPDALRDRIEGSVGLELTVDDAGHVSDAHVTSPAGHGFDEAALAAARSFVFEPAHEGGKPIKSAVQFAYEFHLPPPPAPPVLVAPLPPPPPPPGGKGDTLQTGPKQSTLVIGQRNPPASLEHVAASDNTVSRTELSLVPRLRAEGVLESVPGLFSVQHAGGGKAQQYFLRGFDADHGTDIAFSVDGVPVNAVSHAHGQGFSDLHFLIPETIETVDATKGPYATRVGDFATAGSVNFRMLDHLDESEAKIEIGSTGHQRFVVVESPDLDDKWRMAVAAEAFHENGPFIHPEDFDRLNAYMKTTRKFDDHSEASVLMQAYGGDWNMSGVLPARAVCGETDGTPTPAAYSGSHCISRWDSVDPTQGGASQRVLLQPSYRWANEHNEVEAWIFALHSNLQLFPNDGIAASFQPEGIRYGSQVEQDDTRTEMGGNLRITHRANLAGIDIRSTYGLQIRDDVIEAQLHRDEARVRLDGMPGIPGPIVDSAINETELGVYSEQDFRPAKWLRFILGARFDRIDAAVNNESPVAVDKIQGYVGAQQVSPKATAIVSPIKQWDLFANYGRGFHTNDARALLPGSATSGVSTGTPATLIATATGYELGTSVRPLKGLSLSAVAFLLDLTSELTIDGDIASTSPAGPTERYGAELTGRYNFNDHIFADVAFVATHAQYTDPYDIAHGTDWVTLAPRRVFSAGLGARQPVGKFTLIGSVRVRSMADRPATQNWNSNENCPTNCMVGNLAAPSLTATGFTMVDAEAGLRWNRFQLVLMLLNVGNVLWREGQFAVNSRLPQEGPNPPLGMSFTPGIPRTIMADLSVFW
jgi:TonB family protein